MIKVLEEANQVFVLYFDFSISNLRMFHRDLPILPMALSTNKMDSALVGVVILQEATLSLLVEVAVVEVVVVRRLGMEVLDIVEEILVVGEEAVGSLLVMKVTDMAEEILVVVEEAVVKVLEMAVVVVVVDEVLVKALVAVEETVTILVVMEEDRMRPMEEVGVIPMLVHGDFSLLIVCFDF